MKIIILGFLFAFTGAIFAQEKDTIYSKAYGKMENPAVIFLHGGPGYNSVSFELSTAQKLADQGFYVIVYDQAACGRSKKEGANFTFEGAFHDLDNIYTKYKLTSASLIGHSFGGTVAILYARKHTEKVKNLILVGSPLSYQMSFRHILSECRKIYTSQKPDQLKYIEMLEKMDTNSLEYSSYCFMHAMMNGFYNCKQPAKESRKIYKELQKSKSASYLKLMTQEPVQGFYVNEHYTTLNLSDELIALNGKVGLFGIYGMEDGLFDTAQIDLLRKVMGNDHFSLVSNASHSVFIDQRTTFIELVQSYISENK